MCWCIICCDTKPLNDDVWLLRAARCAHRPRADGSGSQKRAVDVDARRRPQQPHHEYVTSVTRCYFSAFKFKPAILVFVFLSGQSFWFSMKMVFITLECGTISLRFLEWRPPLIWNSRRTSTTLSECWRSMAWATASPACPRASTKPTKQVRTNTRTYTNTQACVHIECFLMVVMLFGRFSSWWEPQWCQSHGHGTQQSGHIMEGKTGLY